VRQNAQCFMKNCEIVLEYLSPKPICCVEFCSQITMKHPGEELNTKKSHDNNAF
jgi:hypothetical protein